MTDFQYTLPEAISLGLLQGSDLYSCIYGIPASFVIDPIVITWVL